MTLRRITNLIWELKGWYMKEDKTNRPLGLSKGWQHHSLEVKIITDSISEEKTSGLWQRTTQYGWLLDMLQHNTGLNVLVWLICIPSELTLYTPTSPCIFTVLFSIPFLKYWQGEFVQQSRASLVCDHFLYSCDGNVWFRGDIVRRK